MSDVLVVGAGLIGTSIGLALHAGPPVLLHDADPGRVRQAADRGAGRPWDGARRVALAVVCTPAGAAAEALLSLARAGVAATYTHVCSVQAPVQRALQAAGGDLSAVCGGHPMAGRERGGPAAADGGLFLGRPWVLCPGPDTSPRAEGDVAALARAVGAQPVGLPAGRHDAAVALVSHLPQLAASALAAQLLRGDPDAARLAGPGLQDSTRIAASDPALWTEVLALNAANVAPLVRALAADLAAAADALDDPARAAQVAGLLDRGVAGRALVPVKRGERDRAFASVAVRVPDRPGVLAALFAAAQAAGVNVEDVRVDHVPGRERGVVELAVRDGAREALAQALTGAGWEVAGAAVRSGAVDSGRTG